MKKLKNNLINPKDYNLDKTIYVPVFSEDTVINPNGNTTKHHLSKFEGDLFDETAAIKYPILRIKNIMLGSASEKWKIYQDDAVIATIPAAKLSKKEIAFLHSLDGFNFLLRQFKTEIKSFNAIKKEIKAELKNISLKKK